ANNPGARSRAPDRPGKPARNRQRAAARNTRPEAAVAGRRKPEPVADNMPAPALAASACRRRGPVELRRRRARPQPRPPPVSSWFASVPPSNECLKNDASEYAAAAKLETCGGGFAQLRQRPFRFRECNGNCRVLRGNRGSLRAAKSAIGARRRRHFGLCVPDQREPPGG